MVMMSVANMDQLHSAYSNAVKDRDAAWDEFYTAVDRPSLNKLPLRELMFRWEKLDDLVKDLQARLERAERQTP
jgi:RNAse (barnase) inhibitor barstar